MKTKLLFALPAIAIIFLIIQVASAGTSEKAKVKWVYDGDTILVETGGKEMKVRFLGLDCPESKNNSKCKKDGQRTGKGCSWQVPHGKKAKKRAIQLLKGQTVSLRCGGKCKDGYYGRLLRYVHLDGTDVGKQLISEGLCEDFSYKYPHPRQNQYLKTQEEAKKKRIGIWK